jgi:hypothetical protein
MGLAEDLLAQKPPVANSQPQQQSSWIKDLLDKRYQPQTERIKRTPVGFTFQREPFDPSSYYKQIGQYADVSRSATQLSSQLAVNKTNNDFAENQAAIQKALGGVKANYEYANAGEAPPAAGTGSNVGFAASKATKYHLGGVTKNVSNVANSIGNMFGIKTIGGIGPGSVPGSDHPNGRALDFMINNVKNGHARGQALADYVLKNAKNMAVKYVIWNKYIWYPGGNGHAQGWHRYSGPSDHTDHVHVSFFK